jgi:hypothetical protein
MKLISEKTARLYMYYSLLKNIILITFVKPEYLRRYSDKAMGWTTEASGFVFRQEQDISPFHSVVLGPTKPPPIQLAPKLFSRR